MSNPIPGEGRTGGKIRDIRSVGKKEKRGRGSDTAYFDLLRLAAIALVILLHVVSGVLDTIPEQMSVLQQRVYSMIKMFCAIGVPLFFMVSGALFLKPEKEVTIRDLTAKYIRRLVLALFVFGVPFAMLEKLFAARSFHLSFLPEAFFDVIRGNTWAHMWYLYTLIGIYLFMPLWKGMARALTRREFRYVLLVLFAVSCVLSLLERAGLHIGIDFPIFSVYVFYYLAGYYIHTWWRTVRGGRTTARILLAVCAAAVAADSLLSLGWFEGYNSLPVAAASIAAFYLAGQRKIPAGRFLAWRKLCFPMFLIHPVFLNVFYKALKVTPLLAGGFVLLPVFWIVTFALSWVTALILLRIPVLNKYVL